MQPSKNFYPSNLVYCKKCRTIIEGDSTGNIDLTVHFDHFNDYIKFVPRCLGFIYSFKEYLGSGTVGDVFAVKKKNENKMCAMKLIYIYDSKTNEELNILRKLNHLYIIDFIEVIECKKDGILAIVMELATSSLDKRIRSSNPLTENGILEIFLQICEGVQYIHKNHIIHRDLKPNNILLQANCVKIADFGISKEMKKPGIITHSLQFQGSKKYSAPEFFAGQPYDESIDIYSLGEILKEMLYKSKIPNDEFQEIITSKINFYIF